MGVAIQSEALWALPMLPLDCRVGLSPSSQ